MALVFLIFDVEVLLLLPWAVVVTDPALEAQQPGWALRLAAEGLIFIGVLFLGLVYIWQRGDIDWIRPAPPTLERTSPVPMSAYAELNDRYAGSKAPTSIKQAEESQA